jgi:hypothetical protein
MVLEVLEHTFKYVEEVVVEQAVSICYRNSFVISLFFMSFDDIILLLTTTNSVSFSIHLYDRVV